MSPKKGGKIDAYIDCASPYSFFAFTYLRRQREVLSQHGVEIEFHPMLLGGVMHATGNLPPSNVPARYRYGAHDLRRACTHLSTPSITIPPFFPLVTIAPQRAMTAIKSHYPREVFEAVYEDLWLAAFHHHIDISKPEHLASVLGKHFKGEGEVQTVMGWTTQKEVKDQLMSVTKGVIEKGGFGAPWFWLTNYETGKEEPLFGSDRWSYMFRILGVEVRELEIVDLGESKL